MRLASDHAEQRQWTAPAFSYVHAQTAESLVAVSPASGRICLLCQLAEKCKELLRLTDEQPVGREGLDRGHCTSTPRYLGRANDRNDRELATEEDGWLGHDQVGLGVLPARSIEVRKHQSISGVGQSRRIACLVVPGLKMGCLGWADTEQDAQHFQIGDSLSQRWVEAGATLLDIPKVEARRVGDRLDVVSGGEVAIVSGNRRKFASIQTRDGLSERATQIWVLRAAAVACPPTGIHGELHEVGEPSNLLGAGRFTTWQRTKLIQIDWISALRSQVRVDERHMAELILGIVVDILGHVPIQHLKGLDVGCTPTSTWDFAVLDASQFVVVLPQIALEDFDRSQESKNGYVSPCEIASSFFCESRQPIGQQSGADGSCSSYHQSLEQKGTAASSIFR
jgi:hypothetical protein